MRADAVKGDLRTGVNSWVRTALKGLLKKLKGYEERNKWYYGVHQYNEKGFTREVGRLTTDLKLMIDAVGQRNIGLFYEKYDDALMLINALEKNSTFFQGDIPTFSSKLNSIILIWEMHQKLS